MMRLRNIRAASSTRGSADAIIDAIAQIGLVSPKRRSRYQRIADPTKTLTAKRTPVRSVGTQRARFTAPIRRPIPRSDLSARELGSLVRVRRVALQSVDHTCLGGA